MSETQSSDAMKNLVLFMTGLAVAGSVIALVSYFAVAIPSVAAILPPLNC